MNARVLLLCGVFMSVLTAPAWAADDWGDDVQIVSDADLNEYRGGLSVAGFNVNFGATVTTFVNGAPALVTTLTWTDVGALIEETVGELGQNIADMTDEQRAALGLSGLPNAGGVVIDDEAGVTALVHNITEGTLQNIIINNATGRDLSQQVDVTLTLPDFELMQNAFTVELFGIRLNDDLRGPGG